MRRQHEPVRRVSVKRSLLAIGAVAVAIAPVALVLAASKAQPSPIVARVSAQHATSGSHPVTIARWRSRHWAALTGRVRLVRTTTIHYRAFNGSDRIAIVVMPRWYGPHNHPAIPLVISPHGRGIEPGANARLWGNMPALGRFIVVNPEGQGRSQDAYSWGAPGQIHDLARMPAILHSSLPWLRIAPHRVYAIGGSMGGQETLLLLAEHPRLLRGAISFDAPTNMAARYAAFPKLKGGLALQRLARLEFGSIPRARSDVWADRSPIYYSKEIAASRVPLQIWWSTQDRIVVDQASESGLLYRAIKRLNPRAPVTQYVGAWHHTAEMRAIRRMPVALAALGLLQLGGTGPRA